ncbi:MAG: ribonuclease P protein component, partial [Alloprevotella sp.]
MSHQYKFPKAEHLCLKRDIERLFSAGTKSLSAYPLRVVVGEADTGSVPVKVLMSVSKRRLHHAVDRNRAKRQMREAYR